MTSPMPNSSPLSYALQTSCFIVTLKEWPTEDCGSSSSACLDERISARSLRAVS